MKDSEEKMKDPEDITMDRRLEGQYSEVSSQRAASLVLKCLGCIDSTPTIDSVITELELLQTFDTAYRASRTSNVKHMRSDR
ncbi:hypothetical protein MKW98_006119 [Papaver atlanticum]|uniref:Uncharacterized protein n=1 Tax=Papaver atlanticum TaxID=357466 RepID=A0AAD4TDZ9_9MAGN|nr:hypothetical protein MKW98_006119 [Papaver atlanticum]